MADNDDTNVINFPRIGFSLTPTTGTTPPPPAAPPAPGVTPTGAGRPGRRSPLNIVNALPSPGPLLPAPPPTPAPQPGQVPDTFRSEPAGDLIGPRLGALGLAATLAVAVAALRGTHTVLSTWWEQRQARHAEGQALREARTKHALAMQQASYSAQQAAAKHQAALAGIGQKAAQDRAKQKSKVPSSSEFGRKTLGGRTNGAGGGAKPNGQQPKLTPKPTPKPAPKPVAKPNQTPNKPGPNGKNNQLNQKKPTAPDKKTLDDKKKPLPPKSPHRGSQGATDTLKKHQTPGKDRTTLPQALKKHANDAAHKRLEKRRNNIDPVLRKNTPKQQDKTPVDLKKKAPKSPAGSAGQKGTDHGKTQPGATSPKNTPKQPGPGGIGPALKRGVQKAAARRWKRRQKKNNSRPKVDLTKGPKKQPRAAKAADANTRQAKARNRDRWAKARDYLKKKTTKGGCFPGGSRQGSRGQQTPESGSPGAGRQQRQQAGPQTPGPGRPRNGRKSPFEHAAQAAGATYTVVSEHVPGSRAKRWEPDALTTGPVALPSKGPAALDAAPTPHTQRPGTSRPKEAHPMPPAPARREDPRITKAKKQAARTGRQVVAQARHMDARHATEITLDDALDEYGDFAADGFKTHDQCVKLAHRATKLRDTLTVFAEQLAAENNLIGVLFTGAMARMSESMDLVARMAEEMQTSSLEAAEMAEAADNDLNDAYRPYSTATADAGLAVPSAPVHNQS